MADTVSSKPGLYPAAPYAITKNSMLLFAVGCVSTLYINLIGQLYVTEIFFLLCLPVIILWRKIRLHAEIQILLVFGALWFLNQLITDLVVKTPVNDYLRGWAGILFLLLDILVLYILIGGRTDRWMAFGLGYALGGLLQPLIQPSGLFLKEPWKFGFGEPTILLFFLLTLLAMEHFSLKVKSLIIPLLILGTLSFFLNARRLGGILWITDLFLWVRLALGGRRRLKMRNMVLFGLAGILGVFVVLQSYAYAAPRGWLGQAVKLKFERQALPELGSLGLIVGGRNEIFASLRAIADAPILGHGSWARGTEYRYYLSNVLLGLGTSYTPEQLMRVSESSDLIPAHSHLLRSWVWGGIMGGVFWLVVLRLVFKVGILGVQDPNWLLPIFIYLGIYSLWDIGFTPLGADLRIQWAFRIATFMLLYKTLKQANHSVPREQTQNESRPVIS